MARVLDRSEQPCRHERDLLADVGGVVANPFQRTGDEEHGHRPFPAVGILVELEREPETLPVEVVHHVVAADEITGSVYVALGEGMGRLADERPHVAAHRDEISQHFLVCRRVMAPERDELRDVHALIAHSLDVLHHVQQRCDEPQVARHWRLRGEQGEDRLVDLEVAPVDHVVVGDHELGELDVLVLDRLDRAVERDGHEVEAVESALLEAGELGAEFGSRRGLHQPNFPVTYCSVRSSSGFVKILLVGPTSTSSPVSMNAVVSATRAACCMLWVTIAIVTRWRSSAISSSIRSVATGSSAEQGSSISSTCG